MSRFFVFQEMRKFIAAKVPYKRSSERKNFVKLKETRLFYSVIELMKPSAVPKASTG